MEPTLERQFIDFSIQKLQQYAGEIDKCLSKLSQQQVWARGGKNQNAIGNLVLHLCGNVRQRTAAVARREHVRTRDQEFSADGGMSAGELENHLRSTVDEAVSQMRDLSAADLARRVQVGEFNQSVLESIYHMEVHFALHSGQIFFATKLATGEDLGFYKPPQAVTGEKHGNRS
jgi:hypothetical protein